MSDPSTDDESSKGDELSPEDVYETMDPLEPYTTGELARRLETSKSLIRSFLNKLVGEDKVRKKDPEPNQMIWIREPPVYECANCGYEFQIKFLHPVLSSVRLCPQCGNQLE
jgi:predicted Zn-ribbon and HTH transcriptional regulator